MLKKIFLLSACLMVTFSLNVAKADVRDDDYVIKTCLDGKPQERANCCQEGLESCVANAKDKRTPYFACCKKCLWGTLSYNFQYSDPTDRLLMQDCLRGRQ